MFGTSGAAPCWPQEIREHGPNEVRLRADERFVWRAPTAKMPFSPPSRAVLPCQSRQLPWWRRTVGRAPPRSRHAARWMRPGGPGGDAIPVRFSVEEAEPRRSAAMGSPIVRRAARRVRVGVRGARAGGDASRPLCRRCSSAQTPVDSPSPGSQIWGAGKSGAAEALGGAT